MIPKIIHYCWISGDPYPELIERCIASWHKYLPGYAFLLWDAKKIQDSGMLSCQWVNEAYTLNRKESVADYVRVYALYTEGGIYLDTDVSVEKDMTPLLDQQSFLGYETRGIFEAAIMGAEPGVRWLGKCLDYYQSRHFCNPDHSLLDFQPMPVKLDKIFSSNYVIPDSISKPTIIEDAQLALYPCDYFSPKSSHTGKINITTNTYTVHHFDNHWINKNFVWRVKKSIHQIIINLLGQKTHNRIIKAVGAIKNNEK